MAKLVIFGAFLIALLAAAQATRFTVTTTITEQQEQTPMQQKEQCMQQMQSHFPRLRSCQQFLVAPFAKQEMPREQLQHDKDQCCEGLKYMNEQCRCEAMRAVVKEIEKMETMAERGTRQGQQGQLQSAMQKIREAAENLPNQCNIGGPQQCQIEQPSLIRMFA